MEKTLDYKDIGINCDYRVCSRTEEEVLRKVGEHIQKFHGLKQFSREFYKKALGVVREGSCALPKDCSEGVSGFSLK